MIDRINLLGKVENKIIRLKYIFLHLYISIILNENHSSICVMTDVNLWKLFYRFFYWMLKINSEVFKICNCHIHSAIFDSFFAVTVSKETGGVCVQRYHSITSQFHHQTLGCIFLYSR